MVITPNIKPPDIITVWLTFYGVYTDTHLNNFKMALANSGVVVPIEVEKLIFRDLRVKASPTAQMGTEEAAEFIRQTAEDNLGLGFWISVSGIEVQSYTEYKEEKKKEEQSWTAWTDKTFLESTTGISGTHLIIGLVAVAGIFIYINSPKRR